MQSLVECPVIDATNIEPQLDDFFGALTAAERERTGTLLEALRSNGNAAFGTALATHAIEHVPTLLDIEDPRIGPSPRPISWAIVWTPSSARSELELMWSLSRP